MSGIRLTDDRLPAVEQDELAGPVPFPWLEGRRVYQWQKVPALALDLNDPTANASDRAQLVAFDLDTFSEVARTDPEELDRLDAPFGSASRRGTEWPLASVDEEAGLIYASKVSTSDASTSVCGVHTEAGASWGYSAYERACFGGLYVLDAETLELVQEIDFRGLSLGDDAAVFPMAVAVTFSPATGPNGKDKVHVLVNEHVADPQGNGQLAENGLGPRARRNSYWVVQFDPGQGVVDWVEKVEACTGEHDGRAGNVYEAPHAVVFRDRDAIRPTVWVGCPGSGTNVGWVGALDLDPASPDGPPVGQRRFPGPGNFGGVWADPVSERLVFQSSSSSAVSWWVFDGELGAFIAQLGVGAYNRSQQLSTFGLDPVSGRFYVFASPYEERGEVVATAGGGLGYTDLRRATVAQLAWDRSLSDLGQRGGEQYVGSDTPMLVDAAPDAGVRRIFLRTGLVGDEEAAPYFTVIEDTVPIGADLTDEIDSSRTVDVPEVPGATVATYSGDARGYGLRHIEVGGLYSATHSGTNGSPLVTGNAENQSGYTNGCLFTDREVILGLAGAAKRDERSRINNLGSATSSAQAFYADPQTQDDLNKPFSRCGGDSTKRLNVGAGTPEAMLEFLDETAGSDDSASLRELYPDLYADPPTWEELGQRLPARGLDDQDEPGLRWLYGQAGHKTDPFVGASCAVPDRPVDRRGDPIMAGFHAEVTCAQDHIAGNSQTALAAIGPVSIGDAGSRYDVVRDGTGGIESRVTSWARDVRVVGEAGHVTIDRVTASAQAWASGRAQPEAGADDGASEAADACDQERTAGACYERSINGVTVASDDGTIFTCDPCNDPSTQQQMVVAMEQALGNEWSVSLRQPDPDLAGGSVDGYEAGVAKRDIELEADAGLKGDLLPTLPALEIVRVRDTERGRGRQVFLFAGVETNLRYGIDCLLTVMDAQCVPEAASLTISLTDVDGGPLQGGVFAVRPDPDGDGALTLEETLLEAHPCTTDPSGLCQFDALPAGDYVVQETLAPPGFEPAPDTSVSLPPGSSGRLDVVNAAPSVTGISIQLTDTSQPPAPLAGGVFDVVAAGTSQITLASCTTDVHGTCQFELSQDATDEVTILSSFGGLDVPVLQVPAGPYVIHQASAPDGYEPVDDIPFSLPEAQIARVRLSNGPVVASGDGVDPTGAPTAEPSATPSAQPTSPPEREDVALVPQPSAPPPSFTVTLPETPPAQVAGPQGDTTVVQVFQNPVQAARMMLRDPKQAAAFGAAWLLIGAAVAAAWRRKLLMQLLSA